MRPLRLLIAALATAALGLTGTATASATTGATTTDTVARVVVVDGPPATGGRVGAATADEHTGMRTLVLARVGDRDLTLPAGASAGLRTGDRVTVTTDAGADGTPVVTGVRLRARTGALATAATAQGRHTLTVLPIYWTAPDAATQASLSQLAQDTADYWSRQSGGRITIDAGVRDWRPSTGTPTCSPGALTSQALAAHGLAAPTSRFEHILVYFPQRSDCGGWAGLAEVGGSTIWVNGYPLIDVTAHEFGHNLGLGHANTATCTSGSTRVTFSTTCTAKEYADMADVMGAATYAASGNLNTGLADALGLVRTVTPPSGTRSTVDLAPLGQVDGVRALRLPVTGGTLYADYRPAVAPDTRRSAWAGVQLHVVPTASYPASRLLDGQPTTSTPFSAVSLPVGGTFAVPGTGLSITVTGSDATAAHLSVAPATASGATPVPALASPAPNAFTGPDVTVSYTVSPAQIVQVLVDGTPTATGTAAATSGRLALKGLTDGPHTLALRAVTTDGTPGSSSAPVSIRVDATAPTAPVSPTMSTAGVLSWKPGSDAGSGVAGYLVAVDQRPAVRVAASPVRVALTTGRHTWWVATVDRVGNASAPVGLVVEKSTTTRSQRLSTGSVRTVTYVSVRVTGRVPAAAATRTLSAPAATR